jgi:bacteriocin-like protein
MTGDEKKPLAQKPPTPTTDEKNIELTDNQLNQVTGGIGPGGSGSGQAEIAGGWNRVKN